MFEGFTPAAIDFLWGIRFNNNREWFLEHKKEYEKELYRPMLALAETVKELAPIEGTVTKTSRIYRDVRYSNGVPYKEHLWFCVREDNVFWSEHPSMYFQIEPEGGSFGFLLWSPKARLMDPPEAYAENPQGVFEARNANSGGWTVYEQFHLLQAPQGWRNPCAGALVSDEKLLF